MPTTTHHYIVGFYGRSPKEALGGEKLAPTPLPAKKELLMLIDMVLLKHQSEENFKPWWKLLFAPLFLYSRVAFQCLVPRRRQGDALLPSAYLLFLV